MNNVPYVLEETDNFAVVFKPPKMHCTFSNARFLHEPLSADPNLRLEEKRTLFEWYKEQSNNNDVSIMHRLDYETNGLVLFAKNKNSFIFFKDLQDRGEFIKEYSAVCSQNANAILEGFPAIDPVSLQQKFIIESFFRPYGPGRKHVRPVIADGKKHKEVAADKEGGFYRTEVIAVNKNIFTVRINRGFRHQIRCHLYWIGYPIINDPLYSGAMEDTASGFLALRSHALCFTDPSNGRQKESRIPSLEKELF
jgi:23S rRNA pseudouridine1911/1915/1917 synthase